VAGPSTSFVFSAASAALALLVGASPANAQRTNAAETPRVGTGQIGQRETSAQSPSHVKPMARLSTRIKNRVDSRIRNRIEPGYNPQMDAAAPIGQAARDAAHPTR